MNSKYTPPQTKVVTSVALEQDVYKYLKRVPNRSYLVNAVMKRHIRLEQARIRREQEQYNAGADVLVTIEK